MEFTIPYGTEFRYCLKDSCCLFSSETLFSKTSSNLLNLHCIGVMAYTLQATYPDLYEDRCVGRLLLSQN